MAEFFGSLVRNILIDRHFAELGRIGRLIGATAQNPKFLGIGIDENTVVILEENRSFKVMGAGAVYVLDARQSTGCNISEAESDSALSIFNVRFHLLSAGDQFYLVKSEPKNR